MLRLDSSARAIIWRKSALVFAGAPTEAARVARLVVAANASPVARVPREAALAVLGGVDDLLAFSLRSEETFLI